MSARALSSADFELLREYLRRTAGLEFDEGRRAGLASVVHERLAATGAGAVSDYLSVLEGADLAGERQRLLDAVTIQETHFHRARPQIDALRTQILPDVLRRAARDGRPVVVWSAGCSTGEEPFTLAMLMREVADDLAAPAPRMRVVGTDVSTAALQVARAATYSGRTIDLAERSAVERWLRREADGTYVVRDEVRDMVEFAHHNLVTDPPPFGPGEVDLVVCRHVTIYFSRQTTRALVERFRVCLGTNGWLLLGPAESLWQVSESFALQAVGEAFAYRANRAPATTHGPLLRPAAVAGPPTGHPTPPSRPAPRRLLARTPAPARPWARPVDHLSAATAAFDAGSYEEAAALAKKALVVDPVSAAAYLLVGHARLNQGDPGRAIEPLQRAVFLDPAAGNAHFLLAVALSSAGRSRQAAPSYRAAAGTLPGTPAETVRRMLDGRRLAELVQLCHRLADEAEAGDDAIRRRA